MLEKVTKKEVSADKSWVNQTVIMSKSLLAHRANTPNGVSAQPENYCCDTGNHHFLNLTQDLSALTKRACGGNKFSPHTLFFGFTTNQAIILPYTLLDE